MKIMAWTLIKRGQLSREHIEISTCLPACRTVPTLSTAPYRFPDTMPGRKVEVNEEKLQCGHSESKRAAYSTTSKKRKALGLNVSVGTMSDSTNHWHLTRALSEQ